MSLPILFLVGATHRTAPFGFREKLALDTEMEAALAADLVRLPCLREFAILNTCNRVEIYGVATDCEAPRRVSAAFCRLRDIDDGELARFGFRWNCKGPLRAIDFGSGPATGACGIGAGEQPVVAFMRIFS